MSMKNHNIKSLKSKLLVLLVAVVFTHCSKSFLEIPPQGERKAVEFWTSPDDITKAVYAIYANLNGWGNIAFNPIAIESLGSDNAEKGSDPGDATFLNDFDNFTATATNGALSGYWEALYQNINNCNQVLDNIGKVTMDASLKDRCIAEAKFIRGYSYFKLVRAFGGVPVRLTVPSGASEYNLPRSTKEEVYKVVEDDWKAAAAVLPASYSGGDVGRATKGMALAYLAKMYMYLGKWDEVLNYTDQVIALGVYSLYTDYHKMFRLEGENCSESIFEIQNALVEGNTTASRSQYSECQGPRKVTGGGWGFNVPTVELANAFESGDPRKEATILFRGETTPEGDVIPVSVPNARYNQKSYWPISLWVSGYKAGCQQNYRVMRYAEVLLMNAEANNEQGNTAKAIDRLEMIRARARGSNNAILPKVTTTVKEELRKAIWNERRVELAMEYDRYFDVIRQGRAQEIFGPKGWKPNKNEVWPIPQAEIEKSEGRLVQNTGY